MKKLFKHYRLPVLTALGSCLLLLGCTNSDYDFDKVDYTLGFGGDELALPGNNSTKEILLDDLLDISSSDLITTDANGDYKLFKEPDNPINPVKVNVDPITNNGFTTDIPIPELTIDNNIVTAYAGTEIKLSDYGLNPLKVSQDISALDYSFAIPNEVKELEYVAIAGNGADLKITLTLPAVKELKKFYIKLPEQLVLENAGIGTLSDDNTLTLAAGTPVNNNKVELSFKVKGIKAKLNDGHQFVLNGKVFLDVEVDVIKVPSNPTIKFAGQVTLSTMVVTEARGIFDPEIDLNDVGTVEINSLPDFLTEEEVVADIDNPMIWLTLKSTMPLAGTINAQLTSDTHPIPIVLDPIYVAASQDGITPAYTRVVICRQQPEGLTGFTPMIVPNLSELIEKLKEPMEIKFTVTSAKAVQETATVKLGQDYELAPEYRFECPLAFGDKAVIVYSDKEKDWHKDIDKLNLANGAYVYMTGTAVSKIPADMELILNPIDVNGNKLSAVNVDLIKKDVAGTKDAAKESPIEAKISGDISKLDGVELKLKAKSNEALRGVTLNKTTQTLKLNDLKVKLVGKITYDAN